MNYEIYEIIFILIIISLLLFWMILGCWLFEEREDTMESREQSNSGNQIQWIVTPTNQSCWHLL